MSSSAVSDRDRDQLAFGYSTPSVPLLTHLDHWRWTTARANRADSDDELPSTIVRALDMYDEDEPTIATNVSSVLVDGNVTPRARPGVPKRFKPRILATPNKGTPGPDPLANWDTPQLAHVPRERLANRRRNA